MQLDQKGDAPPSYKSEEQSRRDAQKALKYLRDNEGMDLIELLGLESFA